VTAAGRRLAAALALCLCTLLGSTPQAAASAAPSRPASTAPPPLTVPTTLLEVSRFRYCNNAPCDPDAQGYVRGPSGPVYDNPAGRIRIVPGRRVTWTYVDDLCDAFSAPPLDCPGHEVRLENGTAEGSAPLGTLPARSGPVSFEWYVPLDAQPGSLIRFFCSIKNHYALGLTGVFEVVAPRG
jgi:hypothetical protein